MTRIIEPSLVGGFVVGMDQPLPEDERVQSRPVGGTRDRVCRDGFVGVVGVVDEKVGRLSGRDRGGDQHREHAGGSGAEVLKVGVVSI